MGVPGVTTNGFEHPGNHLEPINNYAHIIGGLRSADQFVLAGIWAPSLLDYQAGTSSRRAGRLSFLRQT